MKRHAMNRAEALKTLAAGAAMLALSAGTRSSKAAEAFEKQLDELSSLDLKGNVNHSACRWCYSKIPLEDLAKAGKAMGLGSIELLWPEEYKTVQDAGLTCAISFGSKLGIPKGFNDPQYHDQLLKDFKEIIPKVADAGIKSVICFSGNRNGMSDEVGMENCAKGLDPVVKYAAKYNVTVIMELLNSKVNHPDYMCDLTPWGVELAKKVDHENFKLLYDIYHMQIMEGDVIATIKKFHPYIGHYHTGGVPGRNEIDDSQELYYPAIMKAIVDTGYTGFVGQEFIPKREPLESLKQGVNICDV